ncbi:MAG TPA: MOSC domain-containing protein [Candidatus Binatia bacterium]|nr:MOSC domain-containing protein [Candidatus Binatia bacterium]
MAEDGHPYNWETPPEIWRGFRPTISDWQGTVAAIFITPNAAEAMVAVPEVRAFADRGLEGDRFFRLSWKALKRPDKAVTLIEAETLELAAAELGAADLAQKSRRNIVTRGVPLLDLLDCEFFIGGARLRGIRLFEPCGHLVKLSGIKGIFKALEHRSGLKAAVVSDGVIRIGDSVRPLREAQQPATPL